MQALGLFDGVGVPDSAVLDSSAGRKLARDAAAEGIVLLKNNGILPFKRTRTSVQSRAKPPATVAAVSNAAAATGPRGGAASTAAHTPLKITVLGENGGCVRSEEAGAPPYPFCAAKLSYLGAYSTGYGAYGYTSFKIVTVEAALRARFGDAVTFVPGASPNDVEINRTSIKSAVAAAAGSDLVVMVLGDSGEGSARTATGGEGKDRCTLGPAGASQTALLEAVMANPALASKVVVVHIGSRPLTFPNNSAVADTIPAILTAMRPGEEGGNAIVQILTGEVSPSARLTTTWVRSVGYIATAVQPYWQYRQIDFTSWVDGPQTALFPFGHGLSYTTFAFSRAAATGPATQQDDAPATKDSTASISVAVKNTGAIASAVPVQVYCSFTGSPRLRLLRYARLLCGFTKVFLNPAEEAAVTIKVALHTLARWDTDRLSTDLKGVTVRGTYVIDAGRYDVAVGDCSNAGAAIGLQDAYSCVHQNTSFAVRDTISFNGKK